MNQRFSERHGFVSAEATEITVRHDAPQEMRGVICDMAYESGLSPSSVRTLMCQRLRKRANASNWSEWPNIAGEVEELIDNCEWFEVYDIVEALYLTLARSGKNPGHFRDEINSYFRREGIGWQMEEDGQIQIRGSEAFEESVRAAKTTLEESGRDTAAREIHEALSDLSRRPEPDVTGAIQHAMAALECVARDVCGDPKPTLGELLKKHPDLLPPPLDVGVEKAWGYASERGRHLREGRDPDTIEAELIVGLASTLATYLSKKAGRAAT